MGDVRYATLEPNGTITDNPSVPGTGPLVTAYTYEAAGSLATVTLLNGVTTTYTYDTLHRLDLETVIGGSGTELARYDYVVRADGLRTSVTGKPTTPTPTSASATSTTPSAG